MTSMFDYDDSINLAFDAKIAGKKLVTAKHELLTKTGEFLFLAHSERELALRMQMVEEDLEKVAYRKLSNVSDSKAKLARAIFDEWQLRHANCSQCKTAAGEWSSMGRWNGENTVCSGGGKDGVFNVHSCGAKNPPGGLGNNTGLCLKCEDKLGMKTPAHDYKGQIFNDGTTASKTADNNQVTPGSMGSNAVNGFCHGCGSFLGDMAMGALLASKKTAHDHSVFCNSCQSDPSQIGCTSCKDSLSR